MNTQKRKLELISYVLGYLVIPNLYVPLASLLPDYYKEPVLALLAFWAICSLMFLPFTLGDLDFRILYEENPIRYDHLEKHFRSKYWWAEKAQAYFIRSSLHMFLGGFVTGNWLLLVLTVFLIVATAGTLILIGVLYWFVILANLFS